MKNGRYTNWKEQARVKMVVYQGSQLTHTYYSFYKDDIRCKGDLEEIAQLMLRRVIAKTYFPSDARICFFDNRRTFPQPIFKMLKASELKK